MKRLFHWLVVVPSRHHFFGSFAIVLFVAAAISTQIGDRVGFASSELHRDVMERWGAPIEQAAPSLRFVPSGTVFTELSALPLGKQDVSVEAVMNYRKRGLVYFSGFDFVFRGEYAATNDQGRDIDVAFVFPIGLSRNRVLLSDLEFVVNGAPSGVELDPGADRLVWTGRVAEGERVTFTVGFKGRGLDSFTYILDPAQAVRDLRLRIDVRGGDNIDYPDGVVPAAVRRVEGDHVSLEWAYASLESGIPVGVILPSEKAFDALIATMVARSWAPFLLLFGALVGLCLHEGRRLRAYEAWLVASAYALFFVLLAYLAAFLPFLVAWTGALVFACGLLYAYVKVLLSARAARLMLAPLLGSLLLPTAAVILRGYTGLVYTLEIAALVAVAMFLSTHTQVRALVEGFGEDGRVEGASHA